MAWCFRGHMGVLVWIHLVAGFEVERWFLKILINADRRSTVALRLIQ